MGVPPPWGERGEVGEESVDEWFSVGGCPPPWGERGEGGEEESETSQTLLITVITRVATAASV